MCHSLGLGISDTTTGHQEHWEPIKLVKAWCDVIGYRYLTISWFATFAKLFFFFAKLTPPPPKTIRLSLFVLSSVLYYDV